MATLLARKSGDVDNVIATDDEHHEAMANDPAIPQVQAGSTFGSSFNGFSTPANGSTAFGSTSTGGFGSTSGFGSPTPTTGFGNPTGGFGSPSSGYGATPGGLNGAMNQQPQQNLTAAGSNAAEGAEVLVANDNTDWINKKWRPVMGWVYMLTCTCDFVLFPILWSILQALTHGNVTSQWQPVTLQGAGLYHIAMGAVLGIAAYGRTKEKVAGAA